VSVSALYEGTVRHRRFAVRDHELRHRLALAYIDLDELPRLLGGRLLRRRPGLVRFRRRDYLGGSRAACAASLPDAVRETVAAQTGTRPQGPIRVLTQLRSYGHCFNPVSFYYCMDPTGEAVQSVVAEVTNTPWGERHAYVLAPEALATVSEALATVPEAGRRGPDAGAPSPIGAPASSPVLRGGGLRKALHVSPFMGMDHRYEWRLTAPAQTLSVHIASHRGGQLAFDATLALRRRELTRASLASVTARYPVATVRVLALIYAHGLALKLKGVPLHPHPRPGAV
jgi:DUF1365 family protein